MLTSWTSPTNARRNGSTRGCAIWRRMVQGVSGRAANWETFARALRGLRTSGPNTPSTPAEQQHTCRKMGPGLPGREADVHCHKLHPSATEAQRAAHERVEHSM